MKFKESAVVDHRFMVEIAEIGREANSLINSMIEESSLASVEIDVGYVPSLTSPEHGDFSNPKSYYSRKRQELCVEPKLKWEEYISCTPEERRNIYYDTLASEVEVLMKRAKLPDTQVAEFKDILNAAKEAAVQNAPEPSVWFKSMKWVKNLKKKP